MQKIETGISELLKRQPVTEQEKDAYIQDLQKAMRLLLEEVRDLEEMVALLQKKRFGSSSEATPVQEEEEPLGVFPEAELEYKEDAPEPFKKDQRGVHKISEAGRWKLTSSNETEDRIYDLDEEERICPRCKGKLVWIGKELVREVFEYQRPKLKLVRYWQMSYKCQACHKKGRSVIVRASVPKPLLNHSLVAASVVAEIMYQKYVNAMPLYRQEAAWKQLGVTFSRTTMARWIIRCAEDWLELCGTPCGKSFCKERSCMQMRRWCRSSKRTARPLQKSDAERHLHGVLATLSRCKATSQGNSSIMVTRTIYVRLIIIHGGKNGKLQRNSLPIVTEPEPAGKSVTACIAPITRSEQYNKRPKIGI